MGKNLVEIVITAEDKASGVLSGVGGALRNVGAMAVAGGTAAVAAIGAIGAGVVGLASNAAPIAGVGEAFRVLTADMTGGSAGMLAALQEASGGLVTNTDLMKSFNTAAALVSNDFAEQLPNAMGYLSKVSASTGQSMDYMLDSLVKGVGRLSPMILDNLGIQVNLTEAYDTYAVSIGKTSGELTKAEQQTALMNQVMEKLAENTAGMEGMSNPFEAFKITMANLKDEIGLRLLPVVAPLMEKFGELAKRALPALMDVAENVIGKMQIFSDVILAFVGNLEEGMSPLDAFIEAIWDIAPPELLNTLIGFRDNVLPGLIAKFYEIKDAVLTLIAPIIDAAAQFVSWKDLLIAVGLGLMAVLVPAIVGIVSAMAPLIAAVVAVIAVVALLRNAWENNWGGIQEKTAAAWAVIQPVVQTIIQWLQTNIPIALEYLRALWVDTVWPAIQNAIAVAWPIIQQIFTAVAAFITGTLVPTLQSLYQKWAMEVWPKIQTVTQNVWTIIKTIFEEVGRWINDNLVPWVVFLQTKWDEAWGKIKAALQTAWDYIRPVWEKLQEWMQTTLPPAVEKLRGAFDTAMSGIRSAIQPVIDLWENLVGAVQGFWDWISNKVFTIDFKIPDLPSWATPGSPLPIHTAWKAFAGDMDKIGGALGRGFDSGLGGVGQYSSAGSSSMSYVINIDARGAARGVDSDLRRMVEDVMRGYGRAADARIRTGY